MGYTIRELYQEYTKSSSRSVDLASLAAQVAGQKPAARAFGWKAGSHRASVRVVVPFHRLFSTHLGLFFGLKPQGVG